jgi:hypothetical protein
VRLHYAADQSHGVVSWLRPLLTVAYYLEALPAVATARDNPQRSVSLLAAASTLLEANGSGWLHAYVPRAAHGDSVLAALRSCTSDAAFEQAWARDQSLDGTRAAQYARGGHPVPHVDCTRPAALIVKGGTEET